MSDRIELDAYGQDDNVARANGQSREARLLADMRRLRQEIAEVRRGIAEDSARLDRIAADSARRDVERARKDAAEANRAATKAPLIHSNGTRRLEWGSSHAVPSSDELRAMGFGSGHNHAAYAQHVARLQGVARAQRAHDAAHAGPPPLEIIHAGPPGSASDAEAVDESTLTPYQRHVRALQRLNPKR